METLVSATRQARPEVMRRSQKRDITLAVMKGPQTIEQLCRRLGVKTTQAPAVKRKIRVMRRQGLVKTKLQAA